MTADFVNASDPSSVPSTTYLNPDKAWLTADKYKYWPLPAKQVQCWSTEVAC